MRTLKLSLVALMMMFTATTNAGTSFNIPGVEGPSVTLGNDSILISAVFTTLEMDAGLRYNIPKYPMSYIELSPDLMSDGTLMAMSISLKDIANGSLLQLPAQYLPGGRALPGIVKGRLPAVAFSIPQFSNMTIYLGSGVLGLFIPSDKMEFLNGQIYTIRYSMNGKKVGTISMVGLDTNGKNSGVLLMLNIKSVTSSQKLMLE